MATTDFLLRPAVQSPRSQPAGQENASSPRSTSAAPGQSFSSVYTQQQRASQLKQQQAQQRQAAVNQEKQQQAARHSAAHTAAQPTKAQSSPAADNRSKTKDNSSDSASKAVDEGQTLAKNAAAIEHSGNPLPAETEQELVDSEEELLDPLFLFAMAATAADNAEQATVISSAGTTAKGELLLNGSRVSLLQSNAGLDTDLEAELEASEDSADPSKKALKSELNVSSDKAALLSSSSGKVTEVLAEKGAAERSSAAPLLESAKAAPGTLLNNQAVTPNETIRGDMQPRQDSLLAAQQARQVPGSPVAMQQPGWSQQVTDKVMWMSSQNLQSAEIKLDPAELGRLEIKVSVGQELTQVTFSSANPSVRDSLEGQMHRLRELLAQQGMQDVDVNVSDQSQQQAEAHEQQRAGQGRSGTTADNTDEVVQHVTPIREQHDGRLGLVDDYA